MVAMREIVTRWTTPAGGDGRTVMYFNTAPLVTSQRADLSTFWFDVAAAINNTVSFSIETEGRVLESTTGGLVGQWSDPVVQGGPGASASPIGPDANQGLVRWLTGVVNNGRFLQGRTYIPGIAQAFMNNGNLSGAGQTTLGDAANALVSSGAGLLIWGRPRAATEDLPARPGVANEVTGVAVPQEFAVLRRRRG